MGRLSTAVAVDSKGVSGHLRGGQVGNRFKERYPVEDAPEADVQGHKVHIKECERNQGQEAAQGKVELKTWGLVGRRGLETTIPTRERTVSGDTAWPTTVYWITL